MAIDTVVLKEKILKAYYKVHSFIKYDLQYAHKSFSTGVKNLWRWFPVIWKDRDWDHTFIYHILKFKLENQAHYIGKNNRHTRAKRDAELMLLCSRLIEIQEDELYTLEYMDYEETDHEWLPVEGRPGIKKLNITNINENYHAYFKKYPLQYKRVMLGEIDRFKRPVSEKNSQLIAMEIAHENQERSRKLLFKLLNQHIEGWWD